MQEPEPSASAEIVSSLEARLEAAERALTARDKTIQALVAREKDRTAKRPSIFGTLEENAALEQVVARKTQELETQNRKLEQTSIILRQNKELLKVQVKLAALEADVGTVLTKGGTLEAILRRCCEAIVRHLDAAFARIWTLNEGEKILELQASAGLYTHLNGPHGRVPVGQFKIGLIAQDRKPYLTNQVIGNPRVGDQEWAKREGMVAFAGYPLLIEDRLLGVIAMFARHPLTDTALQALATISLNIALGIEHKRAEERLRESEERFSGAFEHAPIGVALISPEGRWLKINQSVCNLVGYSEAELSARTFQDITHPEDLAADLEQVRRLIAGEIRSYQIEKRYIHADGRVVMALLSVSLVRDSQGRASYFISQIQDITERKRLEAQLLQSQKLETVGRLAGGVAHEFNSIMTAIIGQSELLLEDLPPGNPLCHNAAEIRKAADRAATLTRQLLAYGRKQMLDPEILDLNSILIGMEGTLRHLMGWTSDLLIAPASGLHPVKVDPGQIEQVIMNLAMNAADAMPHGGKLTVETANVELDQDYLSRFPDYEIKAGNYVMLAISDNGAGMSPEVKAHLFEPFFTTKGIGQGTGLGLSTCYGIIKQSGGQIVVYSELARGTTFKIYLPVVDLKPKLPFQRPASRELPRGTETILLVEDDPALRELVAGLLRRLGYTVLAAADGIEALTLKQQSRIGHVDLLFTDMVMPHMSGKELADRVLASYPQTRILFTSAYTENAIIRQGVMDQGVVLLQKPFTPSALAYKLREVLDQQGTPKPGTA